MARSAIAAGLTMLLAGCGGASTTTTNSTSTTGTGAVSREQPADAKMSDPLTASGGSNDCSKNPDFAPIYAGAKIVVCSSTHFDNNNKDAGSVSYTTDAAPAAVLAFAKESAAKSGFTVRIANDTMVSADQDNKRRFMTLARIEGGVTKVVVNWSHQP